MNSCTLRCAAISLALLISTTGRAESIEIYKWVSPDGVTHFSETRPAGVAGRIDTLKIAAPEPTTTRPDRYQSLLEVADSIEASRLERERLRLEQRRQAAEPYVPPETAAPHPNPPPYFLFPYPPVYRPYFHPARRNPPQRERPPGDYARWNPGQRFETE